MILLSSRSLLLAILLLPFISRAQWDPFLPGETHTFRHPESPFFNIDVDSALIGSATSHYWLNSNRLPADCLPQDSCSMASAPPSYFWDRAGRLGDYVRVFYGGEIDFHFFPSDTFHMRTNLGVGQSWNFHTGLGLTATCTRRWAGSVLGQPDSLVTATLSNGDSIVLSTFHGLVAAPDLRAYLYPSCQGASMMHLLGLQTANLGEQMPTFEEIFDFQVGDHFEWEDDYTLVSRSFLRRSILSPRTISANGDTITYLAAEERLHVSFSPYMVSHVPLDTHLIHFIRDIEYPEGLMDQESMPADSIAPSYFREKTDTIFPWWSGTPIPGKTIAYTGGFAPTGCGDFLEQLIDGVQRFEFSTGMGMVASFYAGFSTSTNMLRCYRKNGQWQGTCADWSIYLAADQPQVPQLRVAPNPTRGKVRIALDAMPPHGAWSLCDLHGRVLRTGEMKGLSLELDLGGLSSGVYLFRMDGRALRLQKED